jgi:hypothetical protein
MWQKMLNLAEKLGPKKLAIIDTIISIVLVGVGVYIGWSLKPDVVKVEEKVKVVEVTKEVVVEKEVVRVEVVKVKDSQVVERWHREKTETKSPDGSVVTREVEDKNIDSIVKEKENSTEVKLVEVTKEVVVEKEVVKEKTVTPMLAQWKVGLMGGIAPQLPAVSWAVGAEVDRRIVGPIWAGAWGLGTTSGQGMAGVKVGVEF